MKLYSKHLAICSYALLIMHPIAHAHFPIFSDQPQTLWHKGHSLTPQLYGYTTTTQTCLFPTYSFTYGLTDDINFQIYVPAFVKKEQHKKTTTGLSQIQTLLEYRFYNTPPENYRSNQATVIAGLQWPTATTTNDTSVGSASLGFISNVCAVHESEYWFAYGSGGMTLNVPTGKTSQGHSFYYAFALFHRPIVPVNTDHEWSFGIECNGMNALTDRNAGITDTNSGGFLLFLGPTLVRVYDEVSYALGLQWPLIQKLNGSQPRYTCRFAIQVSFSW